MKPRDGDIQLIENYCGQGYCIETPNKFVIVRRVKEQDDFIITAGSKPVIVRTSLSERNKMVLKRVQKKGGQTKVTYEKQ